jgi:hypothetical protein
MKKVVEHWQSYQSVCLLLEVVPPHKKQQCMTHLPDAGQMDAL